MRRSNRLLACASPGCGRRGESRRTVAFRFGAAALAVAVVLVLCAPDHAQDPPAPPKQSSVAKHDVNMLLRVPGYYTIPQLEIEFKRPKNHPDYKERHDFDRVRLVKVSKDTYDSVRQLLQSNFGMANVGPINDLIKRTEEPSVFDVCLPKGPKEQGCRLTKLTLKYASPNKPPLVIEPGRKDEDKNIRFHAIGTYRLKLDPKLEPRSCVVSVFDPVAGKEIDLDEQLWPDNNSAHYLVELGGFRGSLRSLCEGLRDEKVMPAPFQDIVGADATTLVLGSMTPDPVIGDAFNRDNNQYHLEINPPNRRKPEDIDSAWVLFPVPSGQRNKMIQQYRDKKYTDQELIEQLMKEGVTYNSSGPPPGLKPGMKPTWYRIQRDKNGRFQANFKVEDVPGWQQYSKQEGNESMNHLLVYQFNSKTPTAVPVIDPCDKKGRFNYINSRQLNEWPFGEEGALDGNKESPKEK